MEDILAENELCVERRNSVGYMPISDTETEIPLSTGAGKWESLSYLASHGKPAHHSSSGLIPRITARM